MKSYEIVWRRVMFSDSMTSGLVGAIVGALVAHMIDAMRERQRTRLASQRALVGEIISLHADMKAALGAVDAFRRTVGETADPVRFSDLNGRLLQLEGRASQITFTVMPTFKSTKVRAACDKLRSRFRETRLFLLDDPAPSAFLRDTAFKWLDGQTEQFGRASRHQKPASR